MSDDLPDELEAERDVFLETIEETEFPEKIGDGSEPPFDFTK